MSFPVHYLVAPLPRGEEERWDHCTARGPTALLAHTLLLRLLSPCKRPEERGWKNRKYPLLGPHSIKIGQLCVSACAIAISAAVVYQQAKELDRIKQTSPKDENNLLHCRYRSHSPHRRQSRSRQILIDHRLLIFHSSIHCTTSFSSSVWLISPFHILDRRHPFITRFFQKTCHIHTSTSSLFNRSFDSNTRYFACKRNTLFNYRLMTMENRK